MSLIIITIIILIIIIITAAGKVLTESKIQEAVKLLHESKNDDILEMKLIPTTGNERKHVIELFKLRNFAG
jgi:hypothetical protein